MTRKFLDMVPPSGKRAPVPFEPATSEEPKVKRLPRRKKREPELTQFPPPTSEPVVTPSPRRWRRRFIWTGVVVIVAFFLSLIFIPRVRIIVTPDIEEVKGEVVIEARKEYSGVDVVKKLIPLDVIVLSKVLSQEFPATGEEERETKASGVIIITNTYSPNSQVLVRSTRFRSPEGKIFRTTQTVTVPGTKVVDGKVVPGTLSVEVVADKPGEDYNIAPTTFRLPGFESSPKFDKITGRSDEPMRGGSRGRTRVVTQSDAAKAEEVMRKQLDSELRQELLTKLSSGFVLLDGAYEIKVESVDVLPPAGEAVTTFRVQLRGTINGLAVRGDDIKAVIRAAALNMFPESRRIREEEEEINPKVEERNVAGGLLRLKVTFREMVQGIIDVNYISDQLRAKPYQEGVRILENNPSIAKVRFIFWPPWISDFPQSPSKMRARVKE